MTKPANNDGSDAVGASSPDAKSAEAEANIFSRLFFVWAQPLFKAASERHKANQGLEQEDLLPLLECDLGLRIGPAFEKAWRDQITTATVNAADGTTETTDEGRNKAKLSIAIGAVIGKRFVVAGMIKVLNSCLQFTFPILLNAILKFIENSQRRTPNENDPWYVTYEGYWLSALLFLTMGSKAITENMYFHAVYRSAYQARVAVSVAVYNKALRLTSSERHGTTLGEMVNLMQVDASKIEMFVPQLHVLWDGMLQIIGYLTILYTLIGWPCFAGLGVMILAIPASGMIMKRLFGLNRKMVKYTDNRVKITNEAIQGIGCVKMYTWEDSFQKVIAQERKEELDILKRMAYLRGASRAYVGALPGVVAVVSFVVYALSGIGEISASTLFAALVAFGQLRFPLMFYPLALAQYAQAKVSTSRVEKFLKMKEVRYDKSVYNRSDESLNTGAVKVNNAAIYWSDPNIPITDDSSQSSRLSRSNHSLASSATSMKDDSDNKKSATLAADSEVAELKYPRPILNDVNFDVASGDLIAVIGRVGSGKSTLISAILNEAVIGNGSVALNGSIAYVAQNAWILNATLRDNITFGQKFDQDKYDKIITACQLTHDLDMLDNGDMTEIGENGINLSGGQRQRVSIARAAYSEADIILLDDPLSALDPEVGKKLFDECVVNLMKNSTRILVTNQLQFLQSCDSIAALDNGTISEQGTFDELSKNDGEVAKLLRDLATKHEEVPAKSQKKSSKEFKKDVKEDNNAKKDGGGLVTEEERNVGAVSVDVYKNYVRAGGGFLMFTLTFFLFILCSANDLLNALWLTFWTSDANYERQTQAFYLGFYALSCVTSGVFVFFRSMSLTRFGVHASEHLHKGLLVSVLKAPMSFFDTTPTGRILSRFSKDLYSVDLEITENMDFAIFAALTVAVSLSSIVFVTPWFGVAIIPIIFMYVKVLNFFREVSRETKRIESISRSPVFAHFSETLGGLGTIQAYGEGGRFISDFSGKVDSNTQATYNNRCADRWLSTRLELLGSFIAGLAAVFACSVVINNSFTITDDSRNFASTAGLSLNYAISIAGLFNWIVRSFAQMEASMNAAERILYYTDEIPHEAPSSSKELELLSNTSTNNITRASFSAVKAKGGVAKFDENWPQEGKIVLKNLKMRYRQETPLVIKGLDVEISGGLRVGVVGRTGSGKSSLLLTLLRIVEPAIQDSDTYEAPITIDDVDILRVGLKDLRSAVGIIPQNPVLFSGTIRSNMDPFDDFTDEQIWDALEGCGMKNVIMDMPGLLEAPVAEYGDNLSQGQKQLLCLGRALLKKCRILLLDEATSSMDYETDKEIQQTLRREFAGCTVLTIAHRVNTIMDSDKILVMVDGELGEYGNPDDLLRNSNSIFADIVRHAKNESE